MQNIDTLILFEDDHIIVLEKPQGLLSIEDGYDSVYPNLHTELTKRYGKIWAVHSLDKLTSGVIVFAEDAISHKILNEQFW